RPPGDRAAGPDVGRPRGGARPGLRLPRGRCRARRARAGGLGVRHYVLTRASYGPEWTPEQNAARLRITRGVTARMLRRQKGAGDWSWIVLLDARDTLLHDRLEVLRAATPNLLPIIWTPADDLSAAPWDRRGDAGTHRRDKVAAAAYRHPAWLQYTPRTEAVLQTRLDDDDALAPDYFRRVRRAAEGLTERTALMLPNGLRVW